MSLEEFFERNNISDSNNIDALCELSDYTRYLIDNKDYNIIGELVRYIKDNGLYEAFNWVISIINEKFEELKAENIFKEFSVDLGSVIRGYDNFIKAIEADENACESLSQSVVDSNGEVDSFFNIQIRKTSNEIMYLVSAENFDVRDNDFILYRLLFTTDLKRYVDRINNGENLIC